MLTVRPPEWNIPQLIDVVTKKIRQNGSVEFAPSNISIVYPLLAGYATPQDGLVDENADVGYRFYKPDNQYMSAYLQNGSQIAHVDLKPFVGHCGILAIGHLYAWDPIAKFWLNTVEDYIRYLGYSAIIGGDGTSSGNATQTFLKTHGEQWSYQDLGLNRRMGNGYTQSIFWKLLPVARTLNINWWKGKTKPDAKQVTETRSEGGIQQSEIQRDTTVFPVGDYVLATPTRR